MNLSAVSGKLKEFLKEIIGKIPGLFSFVNRKTLTIGLGGLLVVILVLLIGVSISRSRSRRASNAPQVTALGFTIPTEDLFMASEPEFLPEFLLEQEPRTSWSLEDIRPFWIVPSNHDIWRSEIRSGADRFLEGVR